MKVVVLAVRVSYKGSHYDQGEVFEHEAPQAAIAMGLIKEYVEAPADTKDAATQPAKEKK